MQTRTTTTPASRPRRDRLVLGVLVTSAVLLALAGICGVAQVVLFQVTPHGSVYPQSLLAKLTADYRHWDGSGIQLPPLNPQAAFAAEHDGTATSDTPGIVPVA